MSNTVDNRVVEMQFDNAKFEKGINTSLNSLDKFKQSLNFKGADTGVKNLQNSINGVSFASLENSLIAIESRFSTFGIVGMTAIQNITNRVIELGFQIGHKLVSQIKEGGKARYQNIAQAKFQIEGLGASWEKLYEDMDYAVDGTAYGIDEAAKVASSLSASGYEAGEGMKKALRGVSGVAAMTNSTYSEIGDIFTTIAGNGKLMAMQMNQLSFRGLNVAAILGKQLGYTEAQIREMTSKGQIDFKTFADAMDDAFGEHAKEANKTFNGALANMKAALSRIGENFARPLFENLIKPLNALRELFNEVKNKLVDFTGALTDDKWKKSPLGVFMQDLSLRITFLIRSFKNNNLGFIDNFVKTLSTLAKVGSKVLYTKGNIFDTLIDYFENAANKTSKTYLTVYAPLIEFFKSLKKIGTALSITFKSISNVFNSVFSAFSKVFNVGDATSGLDVFADILLKLSTATQFTTEDSERLTPVLVTLFKAVKNIIDIFSSLFKTISEQVSPSFSKLFDIFMSVLKVFSEGIYELTEYEKKNKILERSLKVLFNMIKSLSGLFSSLKKTAGSFFDFIKSIEPKKWGLIIGIAIIADALRRFNLLISSLTNLGFAIKSVTQLPFNIGAFVRNLKNFTIYLGRAMLVKEVAIAVLALAASLALLTLVDSKKLIIATKCLLSIFGAMALLVTILSVLSRFLNVTSKMVGYVFALDFMFVAIGASALMLAAALTVLSNINGDNLLKSMEALGILMGALTGMLIILSYAAPELSSGALIVFALGVSIKLLSSSMKDLEGIEVSEVIKKILALVGAMVVLSKIATLLTTGGSTASLINLLGVIGALVLVERALKYIVENGIDFNALKAHFDKLIIVFGSLMALIFVTNLLNNTAASLRGTKTLIAAVVGIYILTKAFQNLASIRPGGIEQAISAYILILFSVITLISIMAYISHLGYTIASGSKIILSISLAVVLISHAVSKLSEIDDMSKVYGSVGAILLLLGGLIGMVTLMERLTMNARSLSAASILSLALLIGAVGLAITAIANIGDMTKAIQAAGSIGVVLLSISVALKLLSSADFGLGLGLLTSIYSIAVMLVAIAASLVLVSSIENPDALANSVLAIIAVLIAITVSLIALSRYTLSVHTSIFATIIFMVAMLITIALSIGQLAVLTKGNNVIKSMLAIVITLIAVTASVVALSYLATSINIPALVALALSVAAIAVIAYSLKMLLDGNYDWVAMQNAMSVLIKVLFGVVAALTVLSIVSALTGNIALLIAGAAIAAVLLSISLAMITFAKSVEIITRSIKQLSKINYDAIDVEKLSQLAVALLKIGGAAYIAGGGGILFGAALVLIGAGIDLISVGFALFASSLSLIIKSISTLINALIKLGVLAPMISSNIKLLASSIGLFIKTLIASIAKAIIEFFATLSKNISIIADAISNFIVTVLKSIVSAAIDIAGAVLDSIVDILKLVEEKLPELLEHLNTILLNSLKFLAENATSYGYYGALITIGFIDGMIWGIAEKMPELLDTVVWLAISTVHAIKETLEKYSDALVNGLEHGYSEFSAKTLDVLAFAFGDKDTKLGTWLHDAATEMYANADATANTLDSEYERLAQEHSKKNANTYYDAQKEAHKNADVSGTTKEVVNNQNKILDQSGNAQVNADKTANAYGNSFFGYLQGSMGDMLPPEMQNMFSGIGMDIDQSVANGVTQNSDLVVQSISGLPSDVVQKQIDSGVWNLDESGQYLIRSFNNGVQSEATSDNMSNATSDYTDFFGENGQFSQMMSGGAIDSAGEWNTGLLNTIEDPENLQDLYNATFKQGEQAKAGWDDSTGTNSPAKEAISRGRYWIMGIVQALNAGNQDIQNASIKNANTMMDVYSNTLNKVSDLGLSDMVFTPTVMPVLDYSNLDQLNGALNMFGNDTTLQMATNSQVSLDSTSQFKMAEEIRLLRADINKMANQDLSKIMDGVQINVNADTNVDGTPLKKMSSQYTIGQINKQEMGYLMATGGRY